MEQTTAPPPRRSPAPRPSPSTTAGQWARPITAPSPKARPGRSGVSDGINLAVAGSGGTGARRRGDPRCEFPSVGPAEGHGNCADGTAAAAADVIDGTAHEIAPQRPTVTCLRYRQEPLTSMRRGERSPSRMPSAPRGRRPPWSISATRSAPTLVTRRVARGGGCSRPPGEMKATCTSRADPQQAIADGRTFGPTAHEHAAVVGAGGMGSVLDALDVRRRSTAPGRAHDQSKNTDVSRRRTGPGPCTAMTRGLGAMVHSDPSSGRQPGAASGAVHRAAADAAAILGAAGGGRRVHHRRRRRRCDRSWRCCCGRRDDHRQPRRTAPARPMQAHGWPTTQC